MAGKSSPPKISIVMPSFNSQIYIEKSILSVISQNYPNLELIVNDGGSKDGTLDIIKKYAKKYPKIISWVSKKDKGQTDAINTGLKKARGEILTYLNSDDVYKKGTLEAVGQYFNNNPDLMWAYGKCDIIDQSGKEVRSWITAYKNFWLKKYSYTSLLVLNYISQMAVFWRKEAYGKVGEFDVKQHYVMDYDYWLRLGREFEPGFIDRYLASFRVMPNTKSAVGFKMEFEQGYNIAMRYTKKRIILLLHLTHYKLVIFLYSIMKIFNKLKKNFGMVKI